MRQANIILLTFCSCSQAPTILQSINIGGDGCDLGSQGRNNLLLLCDLSCIVFGNIGFGTVFAAFRSGHR